MTFKDKLGKPHPYILDMAIRDPLIIHSHAGSAN